jgi:hypothetical protein
MADNGKVVVNLATRLEDPERVLVAFLVGEAALQQGKQVTMFPDEGGGAAGGSGRGGGRRLRRLPEPHAWEWIGEGATVFSD